MSLILVVDSESESVQSIESILQSEGWRVATATSCSEAEGLASQVNPDLIVVDTGLQGAPRFCARYSQRQGGPGVVALISAGSTANIDELLAEALLARPFSDQDLQLTVRRCLAAKTATVGTELEDQFTSDDIFGDVLAEVHAEPEDGSGEISFTPTPQTVKPPVAVPPPKAKVSQDLGSQLEKTLSGMLDSPPKRRKKKPTQGTDAGVDALLSQTLSGMGLQNKPQKTSPPPVATTQKIPIQRPPKVEPPVTAEPAETMRIPLTPVAPPPAAPKPVEEKVDSPVLSEPKVEVKAEPKTISDPGIEIKAAAKKEATVDPLSTQRLKLPESVKKKTLGEEKQFGQYTMLDRIAVGGMAEVWKARMKGMEGFQKNVAIKKILPHLTDSVDFVTMFIDEAKLAAQLNHNNIIHIYDLGKIGEDYYIAMEYVEGKDLRSILNKARKRNNPLPVGLCALVTARLASALDHAHKKRDFDGRELGLVHRDVSPQNVLISIAGDIKLCDFGIVKAVVKASKTQMGALKGKLQYMSPEQSWGRIVDSRSDIFSLGACLFEMLTGRRLFPGDSEISVLESVRECRIEAPINLNPDIPQAINDIVLRAIEKDPDERYQSAGEMQRDLEKFLYSLAPAPGEVELVEYVKNLNEGTDTFKPSWEKASSTPTPMEASELSKKEKVSRKAKKAAPKKEQPSPTRPVAKKIEPKATPAPVEVEPLAPVDYDLETSDSGSGKKIFLIAAIVAALLIGGFFFFKRGSGNAPTSELTTAQTSPTEAPVAVPDAVGEEPQSTDVEGAEDPLTAEGEAAEETEAVEVDPAASEEGKSDLDIEGLVDQQVSDTQAQLDEQRLAREEELRKMRDELERLNQANTEASQQAESEAASKPEPEPEPVKPELPPEDVEEVKAAPAPKVEEKKPELPKEKAQAPPKKPEPVKPTIRRGDLVSATTMNLVPPVLKSVSKPKYPPIAKRLKVQGTVIVSVLVDENGKVTETKLIRGIKEKVGINEAAIKAAKGARFDAAKVDGVAVKVWHSFAIPFRL